MSVTLITGADGHVGNAVANRLLENSDHELLLYVRTADDDELATKTAQLGALANDSRCRVVPGDLVGELPFANVDPDTLTGIIHSAAVTNFAVDRDTARQVNVDGTAKLVEVARNCPKLECFGFVSSLYAAGLRSGRVSEEVLDEADTFANHYEWSKWSAEQLLAAEDDLPWKIFRVATILGDDDSGTVRQQNVIHNTLRLLYYGLLSVIPGEPTTRVYTASTEFVARAIAAACVSGDSRAVYHIADSGDDAITLGQLTDTVYDVFMGDESFAKQGILKPLYCDRESFQTLVDGAGSFGGPVAQALSSVAPFAPQLYSDKHFETVRTNRLLDGLKSPDPARLLQAVGRHLVTTRWNRTTQD
jgi:nucleoside-diphosphate-sugar epimerase